MSATTASGMPTKCRLKYLASINDDALVESTDDDFDLQYVDIGNVDSSGRISEPAPYRFRDAPSRARRLVRDGDVIVSTVRTYLQAITQICKPPKNLVVSTGFAVVRPRPDAFDPGYCRFAMREPAFLAEIERRSVGVNYPAINATDLADIPIPIHPLPVQRAIADFLDRETARLDALVAAKEGLLELLTEKRRAIVTQAVTRGLDPSVQLKPSGVEWIGDVPAHWRTIKVTHGFRTIGSGTTPKSSDSSYYGGDTPWVTTSELRECVIDDTAQKITTTAMQDYSALQLHKPGTLLIAMYGATIGRLGILGIPATVNQACAALADPLHFEVQFVFYWFQMRKPVLVAFSSGGGQPNLSLEMFREIRIPVPSIDEQRAITTYLDRETTRIDVLATKARKTIDLLKERRAALISAAVTGQIALKEPTQD